MISRSGSVAAFLAILLGLGVLPPAEARKNKNKSEKRPSAADTTNFLLGIDYSHWLGGPAYFIASEQERADYLALTSDEEAREFIDRFWQRRNERSDPFEKSARQIFEERAAEADKRFRESVMAGRRTDRGTLFVLYGEPESIGYDISAHPTEPDLEVWEYAKDTPKGLDGLRPRTRYWFTERGGEMVRYIPRPGRRSTLIDARRPGGGR